MKRINESTIEVTTDEHIIGDFYLYLRDERGLTDEQARAYLRSIPEIMDAALNPEYLAVITDGEPLANFTEEQ